MNTILSVQFESQICQEEYHDFINISSDDYVYKLYIHAIPPNSDILFTEFLNFGFVSLNVEKQSKIEIWNKGEKDGVFKIDIKPSSNLYGIVTLEKTTINVKSNTKEIINTSIVSDKVGAIRGEIVSYIDSVECTQLIDVSATIVEHSVAVVLKNDNKPTG